jgi:vitamin K-dependent gamma-carboxylase
MYAKQRINDWLKYLDEPVSGASLAVFRICFSGLMLVLVFEYFHLNWIESLSGQRPFHFALVDGIRAIPGFGMHIVLGCLAVLAVLTGVGFMYRPAAWLFFIGYTYVFLAEESLYQNHMYLIALIAFLMSIVPAHRVWSVDARIKQFPTTVPNWSVQILKFQFAVVYFFGGIAKLSLDWFNGHPLSDFLLQRAADPFWGPTLGYIFKQPWFVIFITYGGIVVDFSLGFLLWWRRTFWLGASIALLFHLTNACMFNIDIFPWLMIASIGLFAPADWPLTVLRILKIQAPTMQSTIVQPTTAKARTKPFAVALIHVYVILQILVPMRRVFYPGDPNWTEQANRFAWRMLLVGKQSAGFRMIVLDPRTGHRGEVHPDYTLTAQQMKEMIVVPHLMLRFAKYVANDFEKEAGVRPKIYVSAKVSLNGRPAQDIVDTKVDLAAEKETILPARWILPLK